jgi:hypothetical protein
MAHFAELNENNVVLRVLVVDNSNTSDINGVESEEIGVAYLRQLFGVNTNWKQTSYNNKIRVRYAGQGYTYREDLDAFIQPQPFPSWVLNQSTTLWEPPVPEPALTPEEKERHCYYQWKEAEQIWFLVDPSSES